MKIKIKTCVVGVDKRVYNKNVEFEVGKDIDKRIGESLVECGYAEVIEEEKKVKKSSKKKDEV